jgi:hypothetical protein
MAVSNDDITPFVPGAQEMCWLACPLSRSARIEVGCAAKAAPMAKTAAAVTITFPRYIRASLNYAVFGGWLPGSSMNAVFGGWLPGSSIDAVFGGWLPGSSMNTVFGGWLPGSSIKAAFGG